MYFCNLNEHIVKQTYRETIRQRFIRIWKTNLDFKVKPNSTDGSINVPGLLLLVYSFCESSTFSMMTWPVSGTIWEPSFPTPSERGQVYRPNVSNTGHGNLRVWFREHKNQRTAECLLFLKFYDCKRRTPGAVKQIRPTFFTPLWPRYQNQRYAISNTGIWGYN